MTTFNPESLPKAYLSFLEENEIDPSIYTNASLMPRYIRINPQKPVSLLHLEVQLRKAHKTVREQYEQSVETTELEEIKEEVACDTKVASCNSINILKPPSLEDFDEHLAQWGLPLLKPSAIPGVYMLPGILPIKYTEAYSIGQIYGIDLSSIIAAICLGVSQTDHVLDMCCAPGAKLALLSDLTGFGSSSLWNVEDPLMREDVYNQLSQTTESLLENQNAVHSDVCYGSKDVTIEPFSTLSKLGTVTGVDIEHNRMLTCKSSVAKYNLSNVRLFVTDGCTFDVPSPLYTLPSPTPTTGVVSNETPAPATTCPRSNFLPFSFPPAWVAGLQIGSTGNASKNAIGSSYQQSKLALMGMGESQTDSSMIDSTNPVKKQRSSSSLVANTLLQTETQQGINDMDNDNHDKQSTSFSIESLNLLHYDPKAPFLPDLLSKSLVSSVHLNQTSFRRQLSTLEQTNFRQFKQRISKEQNPLWKGPLKTGLRLPGAAMDEISLFQKTMQAPMDSSFAILFRNQPKYDRVIVDAECTHDGSLRHVLKFSNTTETNPGSDPAAAETGETQGSGSSPSFLEQRFFADNRLETLPLLQRRLLYVGFHHVKPGGELIYSTCSLSRRQNEDVAAWLLRWAPDAEGVEISFPENIHITMVKPESHLIAPSSSFSHLTNANSTDGVTSVGRPPIMYREALNAPTLSHEETKQALLDQHPLGQSWAQSYDTVQKSSLRFDTSTKTSGLYIMKYKKKIT